METTLNGFLLSLKGLNQFEKMDGIEIRRIREKITAHLSVPLLIKKVGLDVIIDDLGHTVPLGVPQ